MAAELRLGVSFDLVYFRQQLQKLNQIAASEFSAKVKIGIDKRGFQRQFNALSKDLKINVNDSQLIAARDRLTNLNRGLATFRRASAQPIVIKFKYEQQGQAPAGLSTGGGSFRQRLTSLGQQDKAALQQLYRAAGRASLLAFDAGIENNKARMVKALGDVGEDSIQGLLNGLKSKNSDLKSAAKGLGNDLIRSIKDVLGIASPSKVFKALGEFSAEGFEIGFTRGFDEFTKKAASKVRQLTSVLRLELASVQDAFARVNTGSLIAGGRGGRGSLTAIGPLPLNSAQPWAPGSRGMYGGSGYEPFMPGVGRGLPSAPTSIPGVSSAISGPSTVGLGRLALPPAGNAEATRAAALALRELEARARSAARSAAVLAEDAARASQRRGLEVASGQVPLGGGGRYLPPGGGGGGGGRGGGGGGRFGGAGAFFGGQLPSNLPGQGLVKEMGSEFGFAAKQVLLFGTTYKALAAITGFPAQVTEAVSALQNFRNTLGAITPSAAEFRDSNDLILGLVDKYNIPLQSARDGFTRLYASMQPAGFNGEEIRTLFTGISKAAATFGMSADKVDRVNYAFAQMASKGQVMSEELKGQLGDVLPGAMSIFAEAAGFEGKDAITDFSKALEDGAYKGDAMKVLLKNVSAIMNKEFGPGAEGAARTFQGAMNRMRNSMKLLYETFEPVAVQFLNSVVTPFSDGIKTLTDGLNSFFTGAAAKTSGGFAIATELNKLRPTFEGIKKNASEVARQLLDLAKVALELGKVFLQIAGNPIVGWLAKLYVIFLPLNTALNIAKGLWAANAIQLAIFSARIATGTSTLTAFRGMMAATGATAKTTGTAIRAAGITLRTFFASTGVGLVLVGLSLLIEKFMSMNQALADTRAKALGAAQAIRAMSKTEALQEGRKAEAGVRLLQRLEDRGPAYAGSKHVSMSAQEGQQLRDLGIPAERTVSGGFRLPIDMLGAHRQRLETVNIAESRARVNQLKFEEQQSRLPTPLAEIPGGGGKDGKGGKGGKTTPATLLDLTRQLNKAKEEGHLIDEIQLQYQIDVVKANQEQEDAVGRMIALDEARHKRQKALQDLGKRLGKEAYEQIQREKEGRREVNRLMVEARFAAGQITAQERDRLLFIQGQIDALDQFKKIPGVTPDDVAAFEARQAATPEPGSIGELYKNTKGELDDLTDSTKFLGEAANGIGSAFAKSFTDILTGAQSWQEGLGNAFQSVASMFADMVAQMLAKWAAMQIIGMFLPGAGTSSSGGTSQGLQWNPATMDFDVVGSANGNVLVGGFQAFAKGGIVTGPTLGLVGEGRFNEAVVPLPDGRKIPVELGGGAGNNVSTNIVVNMNNGQASSQMSGNGGQALGREIEGAVRNVIMKESRPGGLIYSGR